MDTQTPNRIAPTRAVLTRKDGRELRRMTVYLPAELAMRLRQHCLVSEQDVSAFVAGAVKMSFAIREAGQSETVQSVRLSVHAPL